MVLLPLSIFRAPQPHGSITFDLPTVKHKLAYKYSSYNETEGSTGSRVLLKPTIFARSDAAATIYFIAQFCAASIWERRLLNSVFSVKFVISVKALRKASFIRLTKNCDAAWSAAALLQHGTSNPFPCFLPMISHNDRPPCLKNAELLWTACVLVLIVYTHLIFAIRARDLFTWACATRILAVASIRERRLFCSACPEVWWQFERGN